MKARITMALAVALLSGLGVGSGVDAAPSCVHWSVTAPFVGTRSGRRCVPAGNAFDFPVGFRNCQGVPPAGVTVCVGAELNLFVP